MKRVLFLAYLFPPIANSGTQRPLKFAKYLSQYGWEPIVLTADRFDQHNTDPALLDELPKSVRVVRVPMLNELISDLVEIGGARTRLARRIGGAIRWRLQERFRKPDLYALWRPTVRRAAIKLFKSEGFDAIYATGFPWSTLLAGADIATATGRPLIADFRDPWAGEDLFRTRHRPPEHEERAGEKIVLRAASAAISVAPTMTRRLMAAHPDIDESKFVTLYNGFDPIDLDPPPPRTDGKFRFVYTGVWKEGYSPSTLYDVIEWLKRSRPHLLRDVEFVTAGYAPGEARRRGLTEYIRELGPVPHREAIALMHSADVLFVTNGEGNRQILGLPGKLYEYLATGRPVLALTHPDGDAGRILQRVGGGVAVSSEDPGTLLEAVATACRDRKLEVPPLNRSELACFERVNLTRQLAELLDETTCRAPQPASSQRVSPPASPVLRLRPR
jgi:glycosyltransferase involved in cell wall biosynthesis